MDETVKYQSNYHKCEKCNRRTAKQRDGKWICRACHTGEGDANRQPQPEKKKQKEKETKKTNADSFLAFVDNKPINGIGDSLKALDLKLHTIDSEIKQFSDAKARADWFESEYKKLGLNYIRCGDYVELVSGFASGEHSALKRITSTDDEPTTTES